MLFVAGFPLPESESKLNCETRHNYFFVCVELSYTLHSQFDEILDSMPPSKLAHALQRLPA